MAAAGIIVILEHRGHSLCGHIFRRLCWPHCNWASWELAKMSQAQFRKIKPFLNYYAIYNLFGLCPSQNYGPTAFYGLLVCIRRGEGVSKSVHFLGPHQVILSFSYGSTIVYGIPSSQAVHKNRCLIRDSPNLGTKGIGQFYASSPS